MKIIKQFGIIFSLCWLATVIEGLLPIAFPASVIAMLLLLVSLLAGVLKIDHIREKSDFLLANMAFFFIPAGVNVINYLDILKKNWLRLLLICVITTVVTFAATAYSVRLVMRLLAGKKGAEK